VRRPSGRWRCGAAAQAELEEARGGRLRLDAALQEAQQAFAMLEQREQGLRAQRDALQVRLDQVLVTCQERESALSRLETATGIWQRRTPRQRRSTTGSSARCASTRCTWRPLPAELRASAAARARGMACRPAGRPGGGTVMTGEPVARRYPASAFPEILGIRLAPTGATATLVNMSATGVLVECASRPLPGAVLTVHFTGRSAGVDEEPGHSLRGRGHCGRRLASLSRRPRVQHAHRPSE